MFLVALVGMGLQAIVSFAVGIRLLALGRRTRRFPELALAVQTLLPALAYPLLMGAVVLGRLALPYMAPVWFVSTSILMIAISMNYFFTWRVFRPDRAWAVILCGVGTWLLVAPVAGVVANIEVHGIDAGIRKAAAWTFVLVAAADTAFAWTAFESFRYFLSTRRRLRLGLAEATVCNRFLLWALASAAWLSLAALSSFMLVTGVNPMTSAVFTLGLGAAGLLNSVCMTLCFMPPERYLAWLQRRAVAFKAA